MIEESYHLACIGGRRGGQEGEEGGQEGEKGGPEGDKEGGGGEERGVEGGAGFKEKENQEQAVDTHRKTSLEK